VIFNRYIWQDSSTNRARNSGGVHGGGQSEISLVVVMHHGLGGPLDSSITRQTKPFQEEGRSDSARAEGSFFNLDTAAFGATGEEGKERGSRNEVVVIILLNRGRLLVHCGVGCLLREGCLL
jgi:hypothetical protein